MIYALIHMIWPTPTYGIYLSIIIIIGMHKFGYILVMCIICMHMNIFYTDVYVHICLYTSHSYNPTHSIQFILNHNNCAPSFIYSIHVNICMHLCIHMNIFILACIYYICVYMGYSYNSSMVIQFMIIN
jgi:hypothetical protein